jgi:hypothetical protein
MQGYIADLATAKKEIAWRDQVKSPIRGIHLWGKPGEKPVMIVDTEIEDNLYRPDLNIDTRWEAFRDECGWHVYLVAVFKDYDIRRVWHVGDLTSKNQHRKVHIEVLERFVNEAGGVWAIRKITPFVGGVISEVLHAMIPALTLPNIVDLDGLKKVIEYAKQQS